MESDNANHWDQFARTMLTVRQENETLHDHRLRLEKDIGHLERTLFSAKELRNSSAPILTVPDEIILEILLTLRDSFYPLGPDPRLTLWRNAGPAWGTCTRICRRIRRIAINAPTLFTQLSTRISSWSFMKQVMHLSRGLELHLDMVELMTEYDMTTAHRCLTRHGHRVSNLAIEFGQETLKDLTTMSKFAPNARTVAVSWGGQTPGISLNLKIPGPWMSNMTSLTMKGTHIDLRPSIIGNLVELRLDTVYLDGQSEQHRLEPMLAHASKLQRLALINVTQNTLDDPSPQTIISLPDSLRFLKYASPSHLGLLHRLQPSPSVKVIVQQTATPADAKNNAQALTKSLDDWLGKENRPSMVEMTIRYCTSALQCRVAYWISPEGQAMGCAPDFELVRYVDEDFHIGDLLLIITHGFGSNNGAVYEDVISVSFDVEWEYPLLCCMTDWLDCISPMPKLRTLRFAGPRTLFALPHLSRWPGRDATKLRNPAQLFTEDREPLGDVRVLLIWLTERNSRGLPLPELSVPAHVAAALDEMAVATSSEGNDWQSLVSTVHINYRV